MVQRIFHMDELPTQPRSNLELQILRTRHPPTTYLHQMCDLLSSEGITISPEQISTRISELGDGDRIFLAVEGDHLVGYAHLRVLHDLPRDAHAEVASIIVQSNRRREGFGRRLITAAESWARQSLYSHLLLRTEVARTAGHAFFTALGYEQDATTLEYFQPLQI